MLMVMQLQGNENIPACLIHVLWPSGLSDNPMSTRWNIICIFKIYIYLRCTLYRCIFQTTYIKYHQNHFFQSHSNYFLTSIAITWHSNQCQTQHVLLRMSLDVCDLECVKPLVWSIVKVSFLKHDFVV